MVKGYHESSFAVHVGDKFVVKQKRGDRGPALRVTDDDRGQRPGELQRQETSPSTETKDKPTNLAFCHTIPTISAKPKANSHEKLAFNRTTTITERNLQKTAPRIL